MASNIAGLYNMEDTLGSGHFAVVKSARHVFTGLRVAIKVIDKTKLDETSKAHLYQEVRCMKLVSHPSIIRLYEVIDTQTKLYLIEELGDGGDLYDFIMKNPNGVEENLARSIFRQAVSAIQYCHQLHVVHRDLKPENLVFCQSGGSLAVKLTDFGLSRTFLPGEMIESSCGSLEYSAPEILLGDSYDPPKVDVWSLGVILYMLICGRSPFASGGANETLTHIMDGKYDVSSHVTESCKSLIKKMLVVDPSKRSSLDEIIKHPWYTEGMEDDPQPLSTLNIDDVPPEEIYCILDRMEAGGYGNRDAILKNIQEKPYSSIAATFYLLAEAERHQKIYQSEITNLHHSYGPPGSSGLGVGGRKVSMQNHMLQPSPYRAAGPAETGVLQPRRKQPVHSPQPEIDQYRRVSESSSSSPTHQKLTTLTESTSPYQNPLYCSPRLGVGGEQVSTTNIRKPLFPIQSVAEDTGGNSETDSLQPSNDPSSVLRGRQLSACEEESEIDTSMTDVNRSQSPLHSPRSRRLLSARSSPNLAKSISRSDLSDEDEDDIMSISYNLRRRQSPLASPHLSGRHSPLQGYSSDEESHSNVDVRRKRPSKRFRYKNLHPLVRVDSASSDDGSLNDRQLRHSLPKFGKEKLRKLLPYRSVPSTPAEGSGSETFLEIVNRRPRSYSARTDSSLSDANDIAFQMSEKFELSDGEEIDGSCESHPTIMGGPNRTRSNSLTQSAVCCIL